MVGSGLGYVLVIGLGGGHLSVDITHNGGGCVGSHGLHAGGEIGRRVQIVFGPLILFDSV